MVVAAIVYHRDYLNNHLHANSILRRSSLWNEDIPFGNKVVVKHIWAAMDDTPEITGFPLEIILLTELESMHCKMATLKADLTSSIELTLIAQLNQHLPKVGCFGFVWGNNTIQKLETLLEKVREVLLTAQVSPGITALPLHDDLHRLGDRTGFILDEDKDNAVLLLDKQEHISLKECARIIKERIQGQLSSRKLKVGCRRGKFKPLSALWWYPSGLTLIQLINLWLVGSPKEHVPQLQTILAFLLANFDNTGGST